MIDNSIMIKWYQTLDGKKSAKETLSKKFNLRIAAHNKSGRKKNELSEEEKEWIDNFPERSDIVYAIPGRRDTIYVGMDGGKRGCKQKRNLLWKLHEVINGCKIITNENFSSVTEAFERELSFHQMYNFLKMHKEVASHVLPKHFTYGKRNKFKFEVK